MVSAAEVRHLREKEAEYGGPEKLKSARRLMSPKCLKNRQVSVFKPAIR